MSFGIAKNVRSEVRVCTPDLLSEALDSPHVAKTCAEIEDALEAYHRGELTKDEFETLKSTLKKKLPIFTFHATFRNGRRKNEDAIPSGLCIYDLDHIPNPRAKWAEIEARKEELGILLSHISPSTEGLRLVFLMLQGMSLADAQAWMARQLGDDKYDASVKDYARCSFVVPREYVLWMDEEKLFAPTIPLAKGEGTECQGGCSIEQDDVSSEPAPATSPLPPSEGGGFPTHFKGTPYTTIIEEWFRRNGGEPEPGERNSKLHRLASHLRYITDNNEAHLLQILPNYGLKEEEMKQLIHSACIAKFYGMPKALKKLLSDVRSTSEQEEETSDIIHQTSDIKK